MTHYIDAILVNGGAFATSEVMLDGTVKAITWLKGDHCILGNIDDGVVIMIEDGSLTIVGDIGQNVEVCFDNSPPKKIGFLESLTFGFCKKAEPVPQRYFECTGNIKNDFALHGSNLGQAKFGGHIAEHARLDLSKNTVVEMKTAGDSFTLSRAQRIEFEHLGNKSELYDCLSVRGKSIGRGSSILRTEKVCLGQEPKDCVIEGILTYKSSGSSSEQSRGLTLVKG